MNEPRTKSHCGKSEVKPSDTAARRTYLQTDLIPGLLLPVLLLKYLLDGNLLGYSLKGMQNNLVGQVQETIGH